MKAKYRIVRDSYAGYEVQVWRWWLPIWLQAGGCNTHNNPDMAEEWARSFAKHGRLVKNLGNLP